MFRESFEFFMKFKKNWGKGFFGKFFFGYKLEKKLYGN